MTKTYKANQLIYIFFMSVLLTSCASIDVSKIKEYPSKGQDCKLEVFADRSDISRPFEVISLIDSRTGTSVFHDKTASKAIEDAKPYACDCGADALLIESAETEGIGFSKWGQGKAIIKAIKYKKS